MRRGAYQLFMWGWVADYPDPENFLFLLWSESARSAGGPNTANFSDPQLRPPLPRHARRCPTATERLRLIQEMRAILERERPWIELFHPESYALIHGWVHNAKPLGMSFSDPQVPATSTSRCGRAQRAEWNQAGALAGLGAARRSPSSVFAPGRRAPW